jgi:beta-lactamase regulating signal transducer with metallopeptidase domain
MSQVISKELLWPAVALIVSSSACLLLMLIVNQRLSRNAALRHAAWVTTFALILLLPLVQLVVPPLLQVPIFSARFENFTSGGETIGRSHPISSELHLSIAQHRLQLNLNLILGSIWLAGVIFLLLRFVAANIWLWCLQRQAQAFQVSDYERLELEKNIGGKQSWQLMVSTRTYPLTPITWGLIRPTVLLPKNFDASQKSRLELVLLHELAHIRRCDNFSQILALTACSLHWFNPLFWYCIRLMQTEAEIACDDAVIGAGVRPSLYAKELLQFAIMIANRNQPFTCATTSVVKRGLVEARISAMLNPLSVRGKLRLSQVFLVQALSYLAMLCVCIFRPIFAHGSTPGPGEAAGSAKAATTTERSLASNPLQSLDFESKKREFETAHKGSENRQRSEDALSPAELADERNLRAMRTVPEPSADALREALAQPPPTSRSPDALPPNSRKSSRNMLPAPEGPP